METTVQNTHNIGYIRSHLSSLMDQVGLQKPLTKMGTRRLVEINLDDEANDSETVFCFNGIDIPLVLLASMLPVRPWPFIFGNYPVVKLLSPEGWLPGHSRSGSSSP